MKISDMTDDERHTFGILVRLMVGADGSTSIEESADLQATADHLGAPAFWKLIRETEGADYPREAIETRAKAVERKEVQETIYGVLFSVATAGSVMGHEAELLDWLSKTWGVSREGGQLDAEPV